MTRWVREQFTLSNVVMVVILVVQVATLMTTQKVQLDALTQDVTSLRVEFEKFQETAVRRDVLEAQIGAIRAQLDKLQRDLDTHVAR